MKLKGYNMAKKDEIKQEKYYALKEANSIEFSELMIQRLGLEPDGEMNTLVFDDVYAYDLPLPLSYDGFKFVSFGTKSSFVKILSTNG